MGKFEVFQDKANEWRWRLKAANGQIIATAGEGYTAKASCEHGISVVKELAPDAPIEEVKD